VFTWDPCGSWLASDGNFMDDQHLKFVINPD